MRIGVFDSGIGGITVLNNLLKVLPYEDYIYYADTDNVPYGPKSKEEVRGYIFAAVDFLVNQNVQAIVIACNTATSIAIEDLRNMYNIPIIGMEPAVKLAVEQTTDVDKRVLVTATELTLKENKLHKLIEKVDKRHCVDLLALPELVNYAEKGIFAENIVMSYIMEQLKPYELKNYETIVLGCTHFSYYRNIFQTITSDYTMIVDGNEGTAKHLKEVLSKYGQINTGKKEMTFYHSGKLVNDRQKLVFYRELLERLKKITG
ncbi:MAG: glutamate racemase [Cellulosilyticaceae bacterium]